MFTIKKNPPRPYYSLTREALYQKRLQQEKEASQKAALEEKTIPTKTHTSITDPLVRDFIDKPKPNTVYVSGSEGPSTESLVEIPLVIAQQIGTLQGMVESLGTNFDVTISISQFPSKVIKNVVTFLEQINEQPTTQKESAIQSLASQMNLNELLECLVFMHHQDLLEKNIILVFITIALKHLALSHFDSMKNITILDDLKSGNDLAKEIIYSPLQEVLKFLFIQKYANQRKIVLEGHSFGVHEVLCSNDGTMIASKGKSISKGLPYDSLCISNIHFNKPLLTEWSTSNISFHNKINLLDITNDGDKILFCVYEKTASNLYPGLYIYYRNNKNQFIAKQLEGLKYIYKSGRFSPSGTKIFFTCIEKSDSPPILKWFDITDINHPELHPITLSETILPSEYYHTYEGAGFINNTLIVSFAKTNEKKFTLFFYDIHSKKETTIALFDYNQGKVHWDIDKNNHIIAIYHETQEGQLYIINQTDIYNQNKIVPIRIPTTRSSSVDHSFETTAIQFTTDGSKIIEKYKDNEFSDTYHSRLYDIKSNKLSSISLVSRDAFNNIEIVANQNDPSIILQVIEPDLANGIAKYLPFKTSLFGLSESKNTYGILTSLKFSQDGNNVIGSSSSMNNNLIVWPLVTKQEAQELEFIKKLPISVAKLLLPLSISSLQGKTTTVSLEDFNMLQKTVPKNIFNALSILPSLLSSSRKIGATE